MCTTKIINKEGDCPNCGEHGRLGCSLDGQGFCSLDCLSDYNGFTHCVQCNGFTKCEHETVNGEMVCSEECRVDYDYDYNNSDSSEHGTW